MIKLYYKNIYFSKTNLRLNKFFGKSFKCHINSFLISPILLNKHLEVYNGKKYIPIYINKKKIGYRLNSFLFNIKKNLKKKEYYINFKKH